MSAVDAPRRAGSGDDGEAADAFEGEGTGAAGGDGRIRAFEVLRRGLAASPELRAGVRSTIGLALVVAAGRLVIPIAVQQILDRGIVGPPEVRLDVVVVSCAIAAVALVLLAALNRIAYLRLVRAAEATLYGLRTTAFAHIHRLSIAHHSESRRGILVARVTSDIETLAQFAQWGAVSWIVNTAVIITTLGVMALYSWQLALLVLVVFLPIVPLLRVVQRYQIAAYDHLRTTVGETLTEVSESVMGAAVIRAYGMESTAGRRLNRAIARQYKAQMRAAWYFALMFPVSDAFGAIGLAGVIGVGAWWGPGWGLAEGSLVACVFLTNLLLQPIGEIGEVMDQTQTAIAGWNKVLNLLDEPIDVVEPDPGVELPAGPLAVSLEDVGFAYGSGPQVLRHVSLEVEPGRSVAVVGETGSGKSTMAALLCRLADPRSGVVRLGGEDLRDVDPASLHRAVRLVPQDGFLFDDTLGANIAMGRPGATRDEVERAVDELGLRRWVDGLDAGLETVVGERGQNLSVGERQLAALLRAQMVDPGLLILDEATSAVDPETERALAAALDRVARGRTTVTVAHRLSTAESADLVVVMDHGRLVESGSHRELVAAGGVYAGLYASWLGNTRAAEEG